MKPGKYLGQAVIWFDRFVNWSVGRIRFRKYYVWSRWGGATNETISHTLGLEEAVWLWREHQRIGDRVLRVDDIPIDSAMILGELSSDLCDIVDPWHALKSIGWKKDSAVELMGKYPGIKDLVERFLRHKEIKD
jgi:hypothetical protein